MLFLSFQTTQAQDDYIKFIIDRRAFETPVE